MPSEPDLYCLPRVGQQGRRLALALVFIAPFLFGALAVWLGQDANWDLRNYHWYNAYALLNHRYDLDFLPSQTPFFYNPALDVPFYLLATHIPAIAAAYVLGAVQGLNFVLLFLLAHTSLRIANPRNKILVCAALATLGMLGGGGIAELGTVFYDNVTSLGLFLSALLTVRFSYLLIDGKRLKTAFFAVLFGIPAGLMMGLKLPSVVFCLGLCFGLMLTTGTIQRRFLIAFAFGVGVLAGVAISMGPWAWFLQTHFGSPLFPYFNEIFKSPLAPLTSARDLQYVIHDWKDGLFFPFVFAEYPHRVGEIPWRDWRLPILYLLMPMALIAQMIFGRSRDATHDIATRFASRYLMAVIAMTYGAWLVMFCIYRYAVPMEMLAPLVIVMAAGCLPVRPQARALLTAFMLVIVACSIQAGDWGRRKEWLAHMVEAILPPLGNTSNLMILMAGFEPYSHIVTQFPPEIPFVRIQSNFASPDENKGINRILYQRVEAHRGRYMVLVPPWQHDLAKDALRYYGLTMNEANCAKVIDRLYNDTTLDLCSTGVYAPPKNLH